MHLKRLTIAGFKSFAHKTELLFGPGITAVVGPNGSGKSNIADALRWVLGEQSIRQLRGSQLQDVIFAGTDRRRPLGMAEVTLGLDNSDGTLGLEFAEVSVTRRVYRSGESEFLINQNACRLKDLQELFFDTGLGRGALALIGQGEIDAVLSAQGDDRRRLLEETAQITRYRHRKYEALRKLEQTEQDLQRAVDLSTEIGKQLGPLEAEAKRAREYLALNEALKQTQIRLGHDRLVKARKAVEAARQAWETAQQQALSREAELTDAGMRLQEAEAAKTAADACLDEARRKLAMAQEALQAGGHRSRMAAVQLEQCERAIERETTRITNLNERIAQAEAAVVQAQQRVTQAREQESVQQEQARAITVRLAALEAEAAERAKPLETLRAELNRRARERERLTAAYGNLLERKEALQRQAADCVARLRACEAKVASITDEVARLREAETAARHALQQAAERLALETERHQRLRSQAAAAVAAQGQAGERLQQAASRLRALKELEAGYEGYGQAVRAVLQAKALNGIVGPVAQIFHVPQALEVAIEVALGGALQHVVTETEADAEKAIDFLKRERVGRVSFLPLDSVRPSGLSEKDRMRILRSPAALGVASDLVSCDRAYAVIREYLLGRTVVTRELRGALELARGLQASARLVTVEGELIVPGGAITGGHNRRGGGQLLGRRRELAELEAAVAELQRLYEEAGAAARALSTEVEQAEAALEAARTARQAAEVRLAADRERVAGLDRSLQVAQNERATAAKQLSQAEAEVSRLEAQLAEAKARCAAAEAELAACEAEVARAEEASRAELEAKERLRAELADIRVALAAAEQRRLAAERELALAQSSYQEAQADLQQANALVGQWVGEVEKWRAETRLATAALADLEQQVNVQKQVCANASAQREAHVSALATQRAAWTQAHAAHTEAAEKLRHAEVAKARAEAALAQAEVGFQEMLDQGEALNNAGGREPEVQLGPELPDAERRQLEREAERLRQRLAQVGPVNLHAERDFEAQRERHEFLAEQIADLESARNDLRQAISEIDRESAKRLLSAYEQVRKAFQQVFAQLFGGGKADLIWSDASSPLEAGLDVVVQPPGKRLQNLLALSGGERALAAIALLLAICSVRPSPFYVLDEVDAALDDVNLARFARLLGEFAARGVQFIVITHRQVTMEAADHLYGVTMRETGVSHLVSLKLDEAAAALAE